MAVVIRAPNVDAAIETAVEFIAVIGDVGGKIRRVAVLADEYLVLFRAELRRAVPGRAVLLVGHTLFAQQIDYSAHFAVLMQVAFQEPAVVLDAVLFEIRFHAGDVARQGVADKGLAALRGIGVHIAIAVFIGKFLRAFADVVAVIAVLRERDGVLALKDLKIARLQRHAEFFDLVARVVDVKFTPDVVSGCVQHRRQTVAQRAAARVAHVHRAGGVGGDKFHHHLFAAAEIAAAIGIAEAADVAQDLRIKCPAQEEIQEAGPGDLEFFKIGAVQREVLADRFGNFARGHAERPRGNHRGIGGR